MKNGMARPKINGARHGTAATGTGAHVLRALVCATTVALLSGNSMAISKDQAKRIYDRIAGVPASDAQLTTMAGGTAINAATLATQDPAFYNNTIRNLATPWTNRNQT